MIDAHFHAWSVARGDYGWLTPELGRIYRDITVGDWQLLAAREGVQGGVLVQAAPTAAETQYLLQLAQSHPRVLGVVGWIDMLASDAVAQVRHLAMQPLIKGLRPMLQDLPEPDWILQPAISPVLEAMADAGLVFDALITPVHLPHIVTVAERHPDLTIVIDHGAKPVMTPEATRAWHQSMQTVARQTDPRRVYCKLSGLWTQAPAGSDCSVVTAWCASLLDSFGPARLIWGSDWPVLELAGDYARWREVSLQVLGHCSEAEKAAVLGGNARHVYQLK